MPPCIISASESAERVWLERVTNPLKPSDHRYTHFPIVPLLGLHGFDDLITHTGDHMKVTTQSCTPHQRLVSAHVLWVCTVGLRGKDSSPPSRHYQDQVLASLLEGWGSQDWKDKDFCLTTLGVCMHKLEMKNSQRRPRTCASDWQMTGLTWGPSHKREPKPNTALMGRNRKKVG